MGNSAPSSDLFTALGLLVDPDSAALLCCWKDCKCAVAVDASRLTTHLGEKHKVPLHARKGLTKSLATLNLRNPDQLVPRDDRSPKHPALVVYDGFACGQCGFRTINLQLIKRHFSRSLPADYNCPCNNTITTDDTNPRNLDKLIDYVYLQTWTTGPGRKYWIIEQNGTILRPGGGPEAQDHIQSVRQRERERNGNAYHEDSRSAEGPSLRV